VFAIRGCRHRILFLADLVRALKPFSPHRNDRPFDLSFIHEL